MMMSDGWKHLRSGATSSLELPSGPSIAVPTRSCRQDGLWFSHHSPTIKSWATTTLKYLCAASLVSQHRHGTHKTTLTDADSPKIKLKMEAAKETVASVVEQIKAALQTHGERLPQTLSDAKLVPGPAAELIPEGFRPTTKLEISYDGKAVDLGNLFRVRETKVQPNISFQREVSVSPSPILNFIRGSYASSEELGF